ncbi:MAG: bile acid:sodium symporter family protein [Burkholderiales bacterium]
MTLATLIPLAIQLSMATIIFCVALHAKFGDVVFLWRKPWLLLRSLLSMLVVMPVLAVAMAVQFDLHQAVEVALVASALSPVPPILPSKQIKAGGESSYVVGLLATTALVSIGYVPLAAALLGSAFHRPVDVSPADVAKIVASSMLLPVLAGMAVRRFAPALALRLDRPLSILATGVLVAACVPILLKEWPDLLRMLGDFTLLAMAAFAAIGLAVGHWLGGPDPHERSVLAMATAARHPAVALAIAHNAVDKPGVMAAVLLALIVASIVTAPYVKWRQRSLQPALAQGHSPTS